MDKRIGAVVATLVAGMFAISASAAEGDKDESRTKHTSSKVKCTGVNECKGKGECAGAGHACAGHNECKGKGWLTRDSEEACKKDGGTVVSTRPAKKAPPR